MDDLYLRLRLGFQAISTRSITSARLLRLAEELSKEQKRRLDKKFKGQWGKYKKEHPDTQKSEGDYVKGLWDMYDRAVKRNENSADPKRKDRQDAIKDKADKNRKEPPKVEEKFKKELGNADVDTDIDAEDLSHALSSILGKDDDEKKDLGERLEGAAEYLVDIVDFDEYVTGLPDKAKQLADHLRKKQEENEDNAQKVIDRKPGITYDAYVREARKAGQGSITKSKWDDIAKKLQSESDADKKQRKRELVKREAERDKQEAELAKQEAERDKKDKEDAQRRKKRPQVPDKAENIPKGEPKWDGTESDEYE